MHTRASPRTLSAAEFFQSPKFSEKVADKIAMLHHEFIGKSGMYSDPEEKLHAHHEASLAVSGFIGNLSLSHPQAAMLLHDMQLDDSQQDVTLNILDHLADKRTQEVGADVIAASVNGMLEGQSGIKKRLQQKFGPNLDALRRIKSEIFPQNFNVEQTNGGSGNDMSGNEAHMQMLNQGAGGEDLRSITSLKSHLANHKGVGQMVEKVGQMAGRRLMDAWGIVNLIGTVIGTVILTLLSVVIPGKVGAIIIMSAKDILAVVTCAQWQLAPLNWIGCVVNLINAVLVSIYTFVPPLYAR